MNKREKIVAAIVQQGILPLYFHPEEEMSARILEALYTGGVRVVEYTNRGKQALKNLRTLRKFCNKQLPDMILGMGTVLDSKTAQKAIENGADFLVSPGYHKELDRLAELENLLWIPGCATATELLTAQQTGIQLIKLFPANTIDPDLIAAVKEVFPDLLFMPTGGIHEGNMETWFRAGASAVGIGGSLIPKTIGDNNELEALKSNVSTLLQKVTSYRAVQ